MKPRQLPTLATLLLAGCALQPAAPPPAVYDLGAPPATRAPQGLAPLRIAEVSAPPWLDGPGMAYRLTYRDTQRREVYRDSRWAAPPAALMTQQLRERLHAPASCKAPVLLVVALDEFEQVFSSVTTSEVVLRISVSLWSEPAAKGLAEQRWALRRPAPSPDAQGAARGLAQAVDALLPELQAWLNTQPNCH